MMGEAGGTTPPPATNKGTPRFDDRIIHRLKKLHIAVLAFDGHAGRQTKPKKSTAPLAFEPFVEEAP